MPGLRNKNRASETLAERTFNIGKQNGFSPLSITESENDYTIAAQAQQIRTLQTLLTEARRNEARLIALADDLMNIIARYDIPLSETAA